MWLFSIWVYLIFKTVSHLNYANESYDGFTQMTNYSLYIEHVSLNSRASSSNYPSKLSFLPLKSGNWLPRKGQTGLHNSQGERCRAGSLTEAQVLYSLRVENEEKPTEGAEWNGCGHFMIDL